MYWKIIKEFALKGNMIYAFLTARFTCDIIRHLQATKPWDSSETFATILSGILQHIGGSSTVCTQATQCGWSDQRRTQRG